MGKTERCPRCGFVIMQTDEACLPSAPGSVKSDKPDPQADGEMKETIRCPKCDKELFTDGSYLSTAPHRRTSKGDGGGIMEKTKTLLGVMDRGKNHYHEVMAVVQAIEGQIEALRKNHQEQIDKLGLEIESSDACFRREADSNLNLAIKTLERKVEELEKATMAHAREDFDFRTTEFEIIRRKIEQTGGLEDRVRGLQSQVYRLEDHGKEQPQPAVAQAPDSDGKMHDLISGESVVQYLENDDPNMPVEGIFFQLEDNKLWAYWCEPNHLASYPRFADKSTVTWLRNLDFPKGGTQ